MVSKHVISVEVNITNLNFVYYADDQVYVQFDEIELKQTKERDKIVLEAITEALGGHLTPREITSDNAYSQASISEPISLEDLIALGWPVSDER